MKRNRALGSLAVGIFVGGMPLVASAAPYAGEVNVAGTAGTFQLNENADSVQVIYNNGASSQVLSTGAGAKSFTLPTAGSTFSIVVSKSSGPGYLSGTALQIGSDSSSTVFNSPRGLAVNQNPGVNFGRVYVSNSAAKATSTTPAGGGPARAALGDGIYVLHNNLTDAVGQGDTALDGGITRFVGDGASNPFRLAVAKDNNVYITDFSNAGGNIYRVDASVSAGSGTTLLNGFPAASTATADTLAHGNFASKPVVTITGNQVSIFAIDELLGAPNSTNNPTATAQYNAIRRFDLGTSPANGSTPSSNIPQTFISNPSANATSNFNTLANTITNDLVQGPSDGRFYYSQNRSAGGQTGLYVVDPSNGNTIFDSLTATRAITGNATSPDLIQAVNGLAISPDNKYLAFIVTATNTPNAVGNTIKIVPLSGPGGLPDLNGIITVTGAFPDAVGNGRDIAFDAAGNLYATSSGDLLLRAFSPGGSTVATTSFNGTSYSFAVVPEPAAVSLIGLASLLIGRRRRQI